MKVCIDPGHGGVDPGSIGVYGLREKDFNLEIALAVSSMIVAAGHSPILTRDQDVYITLGDRVRAAEKFKSNIFVSIHCNAAETPAPNGHEIIHYPGSEYGARLAGFISNEMPDEIRNRGVKPDVRGLYVLLQTTMPAVLVECGFITNFMDCAMISHRQEQIAESIVRGIIKYHEWGSEQ